LCNALQESGYVPEYFHSFGQDTASKIQVTDYSEDWFLAYLSNEIAISGFTLNTDTIRMLTLLFGLLEFNYIFGDVMPVKVTII
jgi:hypothetical protein